MSPLSTSEGQRAFIDEVRRFHRLALFGLLISYLVLFVFVAAGVTVYFHNQDDLRRASCTGRLTVRQLLVFADGRLDALSKPPKGAPPPTAEQRGQVQRAHAFYRDAIKNIDVTDCAGIHLKPSLKAVSRGGSS